MDEEWFLDMFEEMSNDEIKAYCDAIEDSLEFEAKLIKEERKKYSNGNKK